MMEPNRLTEYARLMAARTGGTPGRWAFVWVYVLVKRACVCKCFRTQDMDKFEALQQAVNTALDKSEALRQVLCTAMIVRHLCVERLEVGGDTCEILRVVH